MISVFNLKELERLLEDFYRITQIRITVFDDQFQEIVSYPDSRPAFCRMIRSCPEGRRACAQCDADACAYAARQNKPHIYRCHAGLTEAIMPLHVGKVLVGYLLFGHIFAYGSMEAGWAVIQNACKVYPVDPIKLKETLSDMPMISHAYIQSAAQVLHMTASFLVMERMATLQEGNAATKLDAYLSEHFTDPITAESLCDALRIGRSKLFKLSQELYGCGIQQQVRKLRMEKAKELLLDHAKLSIMEIAAECGYSNYNYFISVFQSIMGHLQTSSGRNTSNSAINGFLDFAIRKGHTAYKIPPKSLPKENRNFRAYIFTDDEIERMLIAADHVPFTEQNPARKHQLPVMFRILFNPVSMLNSQESNVFIMLSSNINSVNKKNSRLIPVRNQTGVSYAPENRQLTVDK